MTLTERWFASRGWTPFPFQRESWQAYLEGRGGLINASTGMGKSYSALFGAIESWAAEHAFRIPESIERVEPPPKRRGGRRPPSAPVRLIWITPLRSLAQDLAQALEAPCRDLGLPWSVEVRSGDTTASTKQRQLKRLPTLLITTPESLSLLLTYESTLQQLRTVEGVVVDEWHELIGSKRGVQTELCLARLRRWAPGLRTWGLSATIGNLEQAMDVLLGRPAEQPAGRLIRDPTPKSIVVETVFPEAIERFPWAGHLGKKLLGEVVLALEGASTSLVFTSTRSQAENWCNMLRAERPDWESLVGLHHGSLDQDERRRVEEGLKLGELRAVVATASLDLGVDFSPVDQVIQIGSPHGVARLIQRAGRSGHRPGVPSRILCVPTHAMELVEFAAARQSIHEGQVEHRLPLERSLDVLAQHAITVSIAGGFDERALYDEVLETHAFRHLGRESWDWVLDFITTGGETLRAYPRYHRVVRKDGRFAIASEEAARLHRMNIGTITSDQALEVRFGNGKRLGTIEEMFISKLRPGDAFIYSGMTVELVRIRQNVVQVKRARNKRGLVPAWHGGRSPLSTQLAEQVSAKLRAAAAGDYADPELDAVRPLLELQGRRSELPDRGKLLIESIETEDGHSLFAFPFDGRLVHEGIAAVVAHRLTASDQRSITATVNDYGIEWASPVPLELEADEWKVLLSPEGLLDDLLECLNTGVLARRQFRDVARIAGLVFQGYPGQPQRAKQLQASSELLFEMFERYDPENLLLSQSRREVLERQLEFRRLRRALERIQQQPIVMARPASMTPFAFPLWVEHMRAQHVSSEGWTTRVERMVQQLESKAPEPAPETG